MRLFKHSKLTVVKTIQTKLKEKITTSKNEKEKIRYLKENSHDHGSHAIE